MLQHVLNGSQHSKDQLHLVYPRFVRHIIKRACSVKVWCTKIGRILRIVVQSGADLAG